MKIDICVNETHLWKPSDYEAGELNGSEEMVVNISRKLASRGHEVTVYCSTPSKIESHGVVHYPRSAEPKFGDALIAFKDPDALLSGSYDRRYMWTADPTALTTRQRSSCDGLFGLSNWHQNELEALNLGFSSKIGHIPPGIDKQHTIDPPERVSQRVLYASSPDRGLDHLLSIWPHVKTQNPAAHLYITYTDSVLADIPGVHFTGRLSDEKMTKLYRYSDVLAYPCTGQERYCITVCKAQMYGCIPVVIPNMALSETVKYGIKSNKLTFADSLVKLLDNPMERARLRREMCDYRHPTWDQICDIWEELINA